jgi:hypothetical protein
MALSDHERHAWEELERGLAPDFPYDGIPTEPTEDDLPRTRFMQLSTRRTSVLLTVLAVGTSLLLGGAITYSVPMFIAGLIIVCPSIYHLSSPA